jgi:asparagine synthase (glutamine-hydrolysing)
MCGIVGYVGPSGALSESLLVAMRDVISHRGPDAAGVWTAPNGSAVLGHRRLSILDLSDAGAQPMLSADRRLAVVFNGEIYNHAELRRELAATGARFVGHSDTEVLLAAYQAWGARCVPRLRGMFAFAIYDTVQRQLFMARDRVGEKPLFWAMHRGGLVFASELKALLRDSLFSPRLSPQGLVDYLGFGFVRGDNCILAGVHKLPPAHTLSWAFDAAAPTPSRYWDLPAPQPSGSDRRVLAEQLQSLMMESVREQLVADVPVAVLLSGGVDSSVVTGLAAAVSAQRVKTFTVAMSGHPDLDESRYARRVAAHFGTEHVELGLGAASFDLIRAMARQYDEPIADSSMIPTFLLARTVSEHCKVVLGGDGGDELFGGYISYQSALRRLPLRRYLPATVRAALAWGASRWLRPGAPRRNGLINLRGDLADGLAQAGLWLDTPDYSRLAPWLEEQSGWEPPNDWRRSLVELERGLPGAAMAADFRSYLPEDILVKVDRASMLCSLEVRAPFLDHRVIEFAFRDIPNEHRASKTARKILLKDVARKLLPSDLNLDRKQGFTLPVSTWLTPDVIASWREECRAPLQAVFSTTTSAEPRRRPLTQADYHGLYSQMMLTLWMRHYNVKV